MRWDIAPETRDAEELVQISRLLACQEITSEGVIAAIARETWQSEWHQKKDLLRSILTTPKSVLGQRPNDVAP